MVRPPYYTCARLVAIADAYWEAIDGEASYHGVDLWALSPQSWFNVIYWWAVQRAKDAERFDFELNRPPPGTALVTEVDLDRDGESFMAFAAAMSMQPKAAAPPGQGVPSPDGGGRTGD